MSQPNAPYLTALANTGARFTNSHGVAHPSQPNYIALFSGSTHGVTGDQCPQDLGARDRTWRSSCTRPDELSPGTPRTFHARVHRMHRWRWLRTQAQPVG